RGSPLRRRHRTRSRTPTSSAETAVGTTSSPIHLGTACSSRGRIASWSWMNTMGNCSARSMKFTAPTGSRSWTLRTTASRLPATTAPSNRVFTFNGDAHSSTVIDPGPGRLVTNIPLGGKPETGVPAGNGKLFVNLVDNGEVVEIDGKSLTVTRRWSTAPCQQPVAMAIDTAHHRLFSGCRSGVLAVSDYQTGRVVATAPIGAAVP